MQIEALTDDDRDHMAHEARRFDGFYAGQFDEAEYLPYLRAGVLRKSYDAPGSFLGLAALRVVSA